MNRFLCLSAVLLALACTDLTETPSSFTTPENFYRNEAEVLGGLAAVYAQLRGTLDDYWYASEVSSDELVVPTRGDHRQSERAPAQRREWQAHLRQSAKTRDAEQAE